MSSAPDPTEPNGEAESAARRNALLIGAVAVLAAVAVIVAVVVATGDDDEAASGGCLVDLARRLPSELDIAVVDGADLVAAREHGYDDSSRESMMDSALDTGVHPDPFTRQVIAVMFDLEADIGYEPADVECWIGTPDQFVARGEFDADRIAGSERASETLVVSDDGRFIATDESFLGEPDDESTPLVSALAALGDDAVQVSLHQPRADREPDGTWWTGSGLAPDGVSRWGVTMVWSYDDAAIAEDAEPQLRDLLREESQLSEYVSGDPSELLERDGRVLSFRSRALGGPTDWMQVYAMFDPALAFEPGDPAAE